MIQAGPVKVCKRSDYDVTVGVHLSVYGRNLARSRPDRGPTKGARGGRDGGARTPEVAPETNVPTLSLSPAPDLIPSSDTAHGD